MCFFLRLFIIAVESVVSTFGYISFGPPWVPLLIDSVQELDLVPDLCFANELLVDEDVSFVLVKKLIARHESVPVFPVKAFEISGRAAVGLHLCFSNFLSSFWLIFGKL